MTITVSSSRKIYRRGAGGELDSSNDAFHSQTVTISDEATDEEAMDVRLKLQEQMDFAVDLHLFVQGLLPADSLAVRNKNRKHDYAKLREVFGDSEQLEQAAGASLRNV